MRWEQELEIKKSIREAGHGESWRPGDFSFVKILERAPRNKGVVELMELSGGGQVAVKRIPISVTSRGYDMFLQDHAGETENPWVDVGVVKYLNQMGYPYVCKLFGVFLDSSETCIVSSFATEGDLFNWQSQSVLPKPGIEREVAMRPIVKQVTLAVSALHDFGIAHCDLSLENILLTREDNTRELAVKLIDFSMAVVGKQSLAGPCGKASYQAPEMHLGSPCNPFMYDLFSLGVAMFVMAARAYPWMSTMPGGCKKFVYARTHGFRAHLKKLKQDAFSSTLTELLETVLAFEPAQRGDLPQLCNSDWLKETGQRRV